MTGSFIERYQYAAGTTRVPPSYHRWCALSVLSSVVAPNVWVERIPGKPLAPNLFVFLVGPSARGKGLAIDTACDLLKGMENLTPVYRGSVTRAAIVDTLSEEATLFFVCGELADSVKPGPMGEDLLRFLTEIYSSTGRSYSERTRMYGLKEIMRPYLSILAGTTTAWLFDSLPPNADEGGFVSRVAFVVEGWPETYVKPRRPLDYVKVENGLRKHLALASLVRGPFVVDERAERIYDEWIEGRYRGDLPEEHLRPTWERHHEELVWKLSMLLALTRDLESLVIGPQDMVEAQGMCDVVFRQLPTVLRAASPELSRAHYVRKIFAEAWPTPVSDAVAARRASNRRITRREYDESVRHWVALGDLKRAPGPRPTYLFVKRTWTAEEEGTP